MCGHRMLLKFIQVGQDFCFFKVNLFYLLTNGQMAYKNRPSYIPR